MDQIAGWVGDHKRRVAPLIDQVLAVIGGSTQRVDMDMTELLRATTASLDVTMGALQTAARSTRQAAEAERAAEARRATEAQQQAGGTDVSYW